MVNGVSCMLLEIVPDSRNPVHEDVGPGSQIQLVVTDGENPTDVMLEVVDLSELDGDGVLVTFDAKADFGTGDRQTVTGLYDLTVRGGHIAITGEHTVTA